MSSPIALSDSSLAALHHLREKRELNTVILRYADGPGVLVPEVEGNLTHDELVQAMPADEPRLVIHDLSFASPEGMRKSAQLLIFWMPPDAGGEETYAAAYAVLKEFLPDVHVHLTARRADQLAYRRLVALAG